MKVIVVVGALMVEKINSKILSEYLYGKELEEIDLEKVVDSAFEDVEYTLSTEARLQLIQEAFYLAKARSLEQNVGEQKQKMQIIIVEDLTEDSEIENFFEGINDKVEKVETTAVKAKETVDKINNAYTRIKPLISVVGKIIMAVKLFKK